ncbi:MAG TPA: monovalent cation/H(+) antiporter subunit G [Bauldia sp.]|nr:monovalent cation/H(+) antiporter subunit G [Bauldia sp.]
MSLAEIAALAGGAVAVLGSVFMVIGALGVVRMPDVFTRLHAASVSDTFGVGLVLIGLILVGGLTLVSVKLAFLLAFLFLTGPVATHAVARAALDAGVKARDAKGAAIDEPTGEAAP